MQSMLKYFLQTFAHHCQWIATEEAPALFSLSLGYEKHRLSVEVVIKKNNRGWEDIWDSVYLNGEWCANRSGGVSVYSEMFAPILNKILEEEG